MTNFTQTLYQLMEKHKISAAKMAEMIGFRDSTFYDILHSENIMLRNALKIVDYFGSSLDYFEHKTKKFYCDFKKDYQVNIYESVKKYMAERNVSYNQICKKLNMSRTNLTRWRDGDSPKYQTVVALAGFFKVSIDEFIGRV